MTGLPYNAAGKSGPSLVPRICRRQPSEMRKWKGVHLTGNSQWFAYGLLVSALLFLVLVHIHGGPGERVTGRASIVDGNTLRIGTEEIRIRGIDAPDAQLRCRHRQGSWACSQATIAALADMTAGRTVSCEGSARDGDGRLIGRCRTDEVPDIGARLVSAGLARARIRYSSDYVDLERLPRSEKFGIWQSEDATSGG